jgi:hypothetical protein
MFPLESFDRRRKAMDSKQQVKRGFQGRLREFVQSLGSYISTEDGQWTVKGFIDIYKNIYTISSDTKVVSKILEIHLFPRLLEFAESNGYAIVLPDYQNYYPDLSFVSIADERIKFAVDLKATYRLPDYPGFCNGFTLGSHLDELWQNNDDHRRWEDEKNNQSR